MHSRLLVSELPRSLPSLPRLPAPPYLPCVEGRQRAAPHSSKFPPTTAPLQTLHMDVWGPAPVGGTDQERYFLLVVDGYTHYTSVFPLRHKVDVSGVLIPWIRATRRQLRERFCRDFPVLHEGIRQTFTPPASPQQNGITERCIGLIMEVARTSMIHAAAPRFLWPFVVRYAVHQLNLWPRVSEPETSPTLRWAGKVGDAYVFRVLGALSLVHDAKASKLSSRTLRCVFLGFPTDAPPWQFYHTRERRGLAPSGVSQVDPPPLVEPLEISSDSSCPAEGGDPAADDTVATRCSPRLETAPGFPPRPSSPPPQPATVDSGRETVGAEPGGAETEGEGFGGAGSGGATTGGAGTGGAGSKGAESGGADSGGAASPSGGGAMGDPAGGTAGAGGAGAAGPGGARTRGAGAVGAGGAAGAGGAIGAAGTGGTGGTASAGGAGAGGSGGAGATGPGGARTRGAGATGAGGAAGAGGGGGATGGASTGGAGGTAGARGPGAAGARGAAGAGVARGATGAAGAGGAGAAGSGGAGAAEQSQPQLLPGSPLPAPAPHTEVTESLTERHEPETRASTPVRAHRVSRPCSRAIPGTHGMALRPSSVPLRFVLPEPPASSLPRVSDPESHLAHAASPTVTRLLATVVTDPDLESTAAFALVTKLADFAARSRLDYVASLVTESESVCPPSVGGEPALSSDVLEDRQFEPECLLALRETWMHLTSLPRALKLRRSR
ncbi:unnamed protein product, partial [Closterium sp. NIES-53]